MHIHSAAVTDVIPTPHSFQDELTREHLTMVLGKKEEEFILFWFQIDHVTIQGYIHTGEVDLQIVEGDFFNRNHGRGLLELIKFLLDHPTAAELCTDSREQL